MLEKKFYRKTSICRPRGIHFFRHTTSEPLAIEQRLQAFYDRKVSALSENSFILVLLFMIQKLCVEKKWTSPCISIEVLCQNFFLTQIDSFTNICNNFVIMRKLFNGIILDDLKASANVLTCRDVICQNGGTCINTTPTSTNSLEGFVCSCVSGFSGYTCETGQLSLSTFKLTQSLKLKFII